MRKFVLSVTAAAFLLATPISVIAEVQHVNGIIAILIGMIKKPYLSEPEQQRLLQQIETWKKLPDTKENQDYVRNEAKKIKAEIAEAKLKYASQSTSNLKNNTVKNKNAGNASSGKVNLHDISVTKRLDNASPLLTTTTNTGVKSNINGTTNSGMKR
jgi:type VI secretion system (T6SS) effector Hcp